MNNIYHYICFDNSNNDLFTYQYFSIKSLINQDNLKNNTLKIYFHYYDDKLLEGLLFNKLKNNLILEKIFFYSNEEKLYLELVLKKYGGVYIDFKTLFINIKEEKYTLYSNSNELSSELIFNEINNYSFKDYFNLVNNYNIIHFDVNNDFLKNISMNFIFNNITIYTLLIRYIIGKPYYNVNIQENIEHIKKLEEKYNLINNIDYIFWINLEKSNDRKENMVNILNNFKIPNIRISAVDGNLISDINKTYYYCQDQSSEFPNFSNKEYAVLLSHLNTIEKFSTMEQSTLKYEIALICEDDLSLDFIDYWSNDLKTIIENAPLEWDIIMLGYFSLNLDRKGLYNKWCGEFSAISYLINYNGAKKLCKLKIQNVKNSAGVFRKLQTPAATHPGQALLGAAENDNKQNDQELWTCNKDDLMVSDSYIFSKLNTYVYKYPLFTFPENIDSTIHQDHVQYHIIYKNNNYITLENIYEEYI